MDEGLRTPEAAEAAFYAAFEELNGGRMSEVWAASTEVFCVHPGGPLLSGREDVIASWLEIFASADPPQMEHRLIHGYVQDGIAVHLVEERIRPSGGTSETAALVLATNIYRLTDGGWRLFSHHASTPLVRRGQRTRGRQVH